MRSPIFMLSLFFVFAANAQEPNIKEIFIKIDPRGTYLFTDQEPGHPWGGDSPNPPTALDLTSLYNDPQIRLKPGDLIGFEEVGAFNAGDGNGDSITSLLGVFSGASGFLMPGPLGTANSNFSLASCPRNLPTDIPQDFGIPQGTTVYAQVPEGANQILFSPNDCFFRDNVDSNDDYGSLIRITIVSQPKYSIQKVPIDFSDDPNKIELEPSVLACGIREESLVKRSLILKCIQEGQDGNTSVPVDGCRVSLSFEDGINHGGHDSHLDAGTEDQRFGELSIPKEEFVSIPLDGLVVEYTAPERAGDISLELDAIDPQGAAIATTETVFEVRSAVRFQDLNVLAGLDFVNITSHPGEGTFGTKGMKSNLQGVIAVYYKEAIKKGVPQESIPTLKSEAASLSWGGIFDIDRDWASPHCGHRNGVEIDLSLSIFEDSDYEDELKQVLKRALVNGHFSFPARAESPRNPNADHWHARAR